MVAILDFLSEWFYFFQSTSHPDASYQVGVNWPFGSGEEAKNRFSRWPPLHNFSYLWFTCHPNASYLVWSQLAFLFRSSQQKIDFQDGHHGGHLESDWNDFANFDQQVNPILSTKFRVNWPRGSGDEVKNRFSRWWPWQPFWISNQNDFSCFWSTSQPDASYQVSSQVAQGCRRSRLLKQIADAAQYTIDIDWPQQLTLSTSCTGKQIKGGHPDIFLISPWKHTLWVSIRSTSGT